MNKLADLKPDQNNARKHNPRNIGMVANSLREVGAARSGVIDEDGNILAGNGTYEALSEAGIEKVKIVQADGNEWVVVQRKGLSEKQKLKLALYDNRSAELAEWDKEVLADIDPEIMESMFSTDELEDLLDNVGGSEELDGEDDVPEAPEKAISQLGDLYQLGQHRLLCGDSTAKDAVDKLMDGQKAEFCFTSPPYLAMRDYGGCDVSVDNLKKFISVGSAYCDFFAVNLGLARKDGAIVRYWDDYISEAESVGLPLSSWNVWDRSGHGGSIGNLTALFPIEHEWILIFGGDKESIRSTVKNVCGGEKRVCTVRGKDGKTKPKGEMTINSHRRIGTVYSGKQITVDVDHPAGFPVHFPEEYINACSNKGDNIYEPFGGSGSTMIASEKLNRKCYMMELDEKYCDVIVKRFNGLFPEIEILRNGEAFEPIHD